VNAARQKNSIKMQERNFSWHLHSIKENETNLGVYTFLCKLYRSGVKFALRRQRCDRIAVLKEKKNVREE
jgi:hypothetical protein